MQRQRIGATLAVEGAGVRDDQREARKNDDRFRERLQQAETYRVRRLVERQQSRVGHSANWQRQIAAFRFRAQSTPAQVWRDDLPSLCGEPWPQHRKLAVRGGQPMRQQRDTVRRRQRPQVA